MLRQIKLYSGPVKTVTNITIKSNIVWTASGCRTSASAYGSACVDEHAIIKSWDTAKMFAKAKYFISRKGDIVSLAQKKGAWTPFSGCGAKIDRVCDSIMLSNELGLIKEDGKYYFHESALASNQYHGKVYAKTWRGYDYFASLSPEQVDAALALTVALCEEHVLPLSFYVGDDCSVNTLDKASVVRLSNLNSQSTALPPFEDWVLAKIKNAGFELVG